MKQISLASSTGYARSRDLSLALFAGSHYGHVNLESLSFGRYFYQYLSQFFSVFALITIAAQSVGRVHKDCGS